MKFIGHILSYNESITKNIEGKILGERGKGRPNIENIKHPCMYRDLKRSGCNFNALFVEFDEEIHHNNMMNFV